MRVRYDIRISGNRARITCNVVRQDDKDAGGIGEAEVTSDDGGIGEEDVISDGGGMGEAEVSSDEGGMGEQEVTSDDGGIGEAEVTSDDASGFLQQGCPGKIIIGPPIIIDCCCTGRPKKKKGAVGRPIPNDPSVADRPAADAGTFGVHGEITSIRMQAQEQTQWCWAAVAGGVDRSVPQHSDIKQCEVGHKLLGFTDICSNKLTYNTPQSLKATLTALNRLDQACIGKIASFEQIQTEIAADRPVCARIAWDPLGTGFEDGAHFVMIVGWDNRNGAKLLKVCDPWAGDVPEGTDANIVELPYDELRVGYNDVGKWVATYFVKVNQ